VWGYFSEVLNLKKSWGTKWFAHLN
jgi:hypothetical protein